MRQIRYTEYTVVGNSIHRRAGRRPPIFKCYSYPMRVIHVNTLYRKSIKIAATISMIFPLISPSDSPVTVLFSLLGLACTSIQCHPRIYFTSFTTSCWGCKQAFIKTAQNRANTPVFALRFVLFLRTHSKHQCTTQLPIHFATQH